MRITDIKYLNIKYESQYNMQNNMYLTSKPTCFMIY